MESYEGEVVPSNGAQQSGIQPFMQPAAITHETSSTAVAAQAKAQVEARFVMALHRPRDLDTVRVKLLKECGRSGFAETARYKRPVGKKKDERTGQWVESHAEGPSIRFAEACMRQMGNLDAQSPTIYDDADMRIIRVSVTDLETNATHSRDITLEKVTEKRTLKPNQKPLGTRVNSYGDTVYLVPATEAEIDLKGAAAVSKSLRTLIMRLVPGDIVEECMERCIETKLKAIKDDPDAARKKLADAFAGIGVMPDQLKKYIGQDLASCSPAQISDLRDIYAAIKDGVQTWADYMAARADDADQDADRDGKSKADALKEQAKAHAEKAKADRAAQPTQTAK